MALPLSSFAPSTSTASTPSASTLSATAESSTVGAGFVAPCGEAVTVGCTDLRAALAALMVHVRHGDQDAFREVYDLTVVSAHATAFRTTRSAEHAAEVVQEVYLHAWQHASDYDPARAPVLGWLLMLTHRRSVDRIRHVSRAVARDQHDFHRNDTTTPDIAELALARVEAATLRNAVRQLPTKQRDAITLTHLHGHTSQEAAALLEVPIGTLKTRVRDGVKALRTHFGAEAA